MLGLRAEQRMAGFDMTATAEEQPKVEVVPELTPQERVAAAIAEAQWAAYLVNVGR
jgi:hypothetical protein